MMRFSKGVESFALWLCGGEILGAGPACACAGLKGKVLGTEGVRG
jgi:hypothetical protein